MMSAQIMIMIVMTVLTYPCMLVAGFSVSGRKLSVILSKPALSVVTLTKSIGTSVTQMYFVFPALIMALVATASATAARSWFAVPNIGQMVLMLPVQMKYAHAPTTSAVAITAPGIQVVRSNGFHALPTNSCTRNRPIRVPASMVVR